MLVMFLGLFGTYLIGLSIGLYIASKWNKQIIENQKEYIKELVCENCELNEENAESERVLYESKKGKKTK